MNNKKDITPRNAKGQEHGYWERYCPNGDLWFKCNYNNGEKIGYWEVYWGGKLYGKSFHI